MQKDFSKQIEAYKNRVIHMDSNPSVVYIESVKGCPYTCVMCFKRLTKVERISQELLSNIEPYYKDLEVMAIHGLGEPLLADLDYFVGEAIKYDLVLHMNTTAFFMSEKISDLLLKTRHSIRFSIHSGRPETYKKIMGHDFDRIRHNIEYLLAKSRETGKKNDYWFSFIVMDENIDEIEDFLQLAYELGVKNVRFEGLIPNWRSIRGVKSSDKRFEFKYFEQFNKDLIEEYIKRYPRYLSLSNKLGITIRNGSMPPRIEGSYRAKVMLNSVTNLLSNTNLFPLIRNQGSCLAPWIGQLIISQDGNVRLCCSSTYSLGNIKKSSLPEIWNSKRMKKVRKAFRDGFFPRICGYCKGFYLDDYPLNSFKGIRRS